MDKSVKLFGKATVKTVIDITALTVVALTINVVFGTDIEPVHALAVLAIFRLNELRAALQPLSQAGEDDRG